MGVRNTSVPSERNTSSKEPENFEVGSRTATAATARSWTAEEDRAAAPSSAGHPIHHHVAGDNPEHRDRLRRRFCVIATLALRTTRAGPPFKAASAAELWHPSSLVADQEDVRRIALSLPETSEVEDHFGFSVRNKSKQKQFVWAWNERVDPKRPRIPRADVLAVRVANEFDKIELLASDEATFFTEPHYDGFPAVLVRLPVVHVDELRELITDAWRAQAPRALVEEFERDE
jgi:hypothetical protein